MIRRTEKLLITFYTTTDAMAMERLCREAGTEGRLVPVPGTICADCGLAWAAKPSEEQTLRAQIRAWGIRPQGFHICLV